MDRLENRTIQFIGVCLPEQQFWYFSLLVLILTHSESELHSVYCFFIPDYVRKVVINFENISQPTEPVEKPDQPILWVKFSETSA